MILVAIDKYKGANELHGCVSDATRLEGCLKSFGFTGTAMELFNENATRAKIMGALDDAVKDATKQRIVFYFSGHGMQDPHPSLCPFDYEGGNEVTVTQLSEKLKAIEANGCPVTALLDSCYSGGLVSKGINGAYQEKFIRVPQSKSPHAGLSTDDDPLKSAGKVCYFTACGPTQSAVQILSPDHQQGAGLFTNALIDSLQETPLKGDSLTWGALASDIQTRIADKVTAVGLKHPPVPCLSDGYGAVPVFAGIESVTRPRANPGTLAAVWSWQNPDKSVLDVQIEPNLNTILPGEMVVAKFKFGSKGYLVGIERIDDKYLRFLPRDTADGQPAPPTLYDPNSRTADQALTFYATGDEHLRFIFFKDYETAMEVVGEFPTLHHEVGGLTEDQLKKKLASKDVDVQDGVPFATADIPITVWGLDLLGNGEILKNYVPFYQALVSGTDPVGSFIAGILQLEHRGVLDLYRDAPPVDFVVSLINMAIRSRTVLYEPEIFKAVTLSPDTLTMLATWQKNNAIDDQTRQRLNLLLLRDAFPKSIRVLPGNGTTKEGGR